ncbi:MAG: S8 family serine peptidase [Planctomycetes bacterium]|nr:S8 family serine peptidase [Planctomycetota bacterium]
MLVPSLLAPTLSALATALPGDIDPALQAVLANLKPNEQTTVFVYLRDQVPLTDTVAALDRMNATRQFRHWLVVSSLQDLAAGTQPPVKRVLDELDAIGEVSMVTPFWIFNGFAVRGTRGAIERLALLPAVGQIVWAGSDQPGTQDAIDIEELAPAPLPLPVPETGLTECKADFLWNLGFTGTSALVANVDTGVDGNHPALRSRWRGLLPGVPASAAWHDVITNTTFPVGRGSHGTHTMGTICGDDGLGNQIGMAPGARWIASNPIDASGTRAQKNVWYNQGIQWMADPDGNPLTVDDVPDVCSNSWGVRDAANGVGPCSPVFYASLDAAEASTVVFCWSAGNEGATGPRVPADRVASPTNTFTVGALEPGSLVIASYSSRGPSTCAATGNIKPEVSARGSSVRSSVPGGGYSLLSGTSMACPHVAGAVALLRDVWPEISVTRAKTLLMDTAVDLGTAGEDNTFGFGRIDLQRAYNQLIAERPVVAVSAMGTRQVIRPGQTAWTHVALSSWSPNAETVTLALELWIDGGPTGLYFLAPTTITIPAGFHNRTTPFAIPFPIPANIDPQFLNRPIEVRASAVQGMTEISAAGYRFVIQP